MTPPAGREDHEVADGSPRLSVVLPDEPPEITPEVADSLLTMLTKVHASRRTDEPVHEAAQERRAA